MSLLSDLNDTMDEVFTTACSRNLGERPILGPTALECDIGIIRGALAKYTHAKLSACVRIENDLEEAKFQVSEHVGNQLEASRNLLANWSGTARDSFNDFLGQTITAQANQPQYIDEVINVVRAYRELIRAARDDAQEIADATLTTLKGHDVDVGNILRGLAGLATTITGLLISPPTGTIAAGITFYNTFNSLSGDWSRLNANVRGDHTADILDAAHRAAQDLDAAVAERAETIARSANSMITDLAGDRIYTIMPKTMPDLADPTYSSADFVPTRRPA